VAAGRCVAFLRRDVEGALLDMASDPRTSSAAEPKPPCVLSTELEQVDLDADPPDPVAVNFMPSRIARDNDLVAWRYDNGTLIVARAQSGDDPVLHGELEFQLGTSVRFVLAERDALVRAIEEHYPLFDDELHLMGDLEIV
jgi:hypothetical protein